MKREQVLPHVMADMAARIAKGADEYGEPLTTGNGRDALQDAYEEALNLAVYLKQAIMERKEVMQTGPVRDCSTAENPVASPAADSLTAGEMQQAINYGVSDWPGPDWSQAPEWAEWWAMDDTPRRPRDAYWHSQEPSHSVPGYNSWMAGKYEIAPSFGYTGDWSDSLRKRPA